MKVYTVWYKGSEAVALWGIYGTEEKAVATVEKILSEGYAPEAWYNEEEVL